MEGSSPGLISWHLPAKTRETTKSLVLRPKFEPKYETQVLTARWTRSLSY